MKLDKSLAEKLRNSLELFNGGIDKNIMNSLTKLKNFDIDLRFVSSDRFS